MCAKDRWIAIPGDARQMCSCKNGNVYSHVNFIVHNTSIRAYGEGIYSNRVRRKWDGKVSSTFLNNCRYIRLVHVLDQLQDNGRLRTGGHDIDKLLSDDGAYSSTLPKLLTGSTSNGAAKIHAQCAGQLQILFQNNSNYICRSVVMIRSKIGHVTGHCPPLVMKPVPKS